MTAMKKAGAVNKWKTYPIGGEIRPEAWGQCFDPKPANPQVQNFAKCVKATHATWLMDSGMFEKGQSPTRIKNAQKEVQKMGYEFTIKSVSTKVTAKTIQVDLTIENRGVAPFYHEWPIYLCGIDAPNKKMYEWNTGETLIGILPGTTIKHLSVARKPGMKGYIPLLIGAPNPMKGGKPLGFANASRDSTRKGWTTLSVAWLD